VNFDIEIFNQVLAALVNIFDENQQICEALVDDSAYLTALKAFEKVKGNSVSFQLLFRLLAFQIQTDKVSSFKKARDLAKLKLSSSTEMLYFLTLLNKKDPESSALLAKHCRKISDMFDHSNEFFRYQAQLKELTLPLYTNNIQETCQTFLKVLKRDSKKTARELKALKLLHQVLTGAKKENQMEALAVEVEKSGLLDLVESLQTSEDEKVFEAAQKLLVDFFQEE